MSISDILVGVNSSALNVPLNHTSWLLDYKINGTKSYVYKDKDILHELYRSPISANDEDVQIEAFNYVASELESYLGLWLSKNYGFRDLINLPNCKSIPDIISDVDSINRITVSEFADAFFSLDTVKSFFTSTNGLKAASSSDNIMAMLESDNEFKSTITSNSDIQTISVATDHTNSGYIEVRNAFILTMYAGRAVGTYGSYTLYNKGKITAMLHGASSETTLDPESDMNTGTTTSTVTVNKFVKYGRVYHPYTTRSDLSPRDFGDTLKITYIQLDNVV